MERLNPRYFTELMEAKDEATTPDTISARVDASMAPLIDTLNRQGFSTRFCCSGMIREHFPLDEPLPYTYEGKGGVVTLDEAKFDELMESINLDVYWNVLMRPYVSLQARYHSYYSEGIHLEEADALDAFVDSGWSAGWTPEFVVPERYFSDEDKEAVDENSDPLKRIFDDDKAARLRERFDAHDEMVVKTAKWHKPSYTLRLNPESLEDADTIRERDDAIKAAIEELDSVLRLG